MPKRPSLFQRVEQARRDVQDLYVEAVATEPLMDTHHHLLAALRSLAQAADNCLPPPPKKRRGKDDEPTSRLSHAETWETTPPSTSPKPVNASGI